MEEANGWGAVFLGLVEEVGLGGALFAVIVLGMHYAVFRLYLGRLNDRQKEIDRLAAENREYRERFLDLLDKKFDYKPAKPARKSRNKRG
ncbi:hypothetical protein [Marinospirillum sp.]|uniref:hypothetical protein n=1 Tax=Marinospirillum sp. TaxID=2183934 RepID=UPI00287057E2|nr:hypothetical protein [Marinospirillum sp.]MDR9468882.1 hypothetical protein [Marinospirillum sp.]